MPRTLTPRMMGAAVALAAAGMAYHTVHEFGAPALLDPASGFLPVVGVQALLFLAWWRLSDKRRGLAVALAVTAGLQLVGGAILSVLPLPFLPFAPEQTAGHYGAHAVLGICQLPLLLAPAMDRERPFKASAT